jgi:hypothetical protein
LDRRRSWLDSFLAFLRKYYVYVCNFASKKKLSWKWNQILFSKHRWAITLLLLITVLSPVRLVGVQGCQMVCFQTKNPNLDQLCRVLQWKILIYFMTIWSILQPLEMFCVHLVHFVIIWYISFRFGILYQEKSGNPGRRAAREVWPQYISEWHEYFETTICLTNQALDYFQHTHTFLNRLCNSPLHKSQPCTKLCTLKWDFFAKKYIVNLNQVCNQVCARLLICYVEN